MSADLPPLLDTAVCIDYLRGLPQAVRFVQTLPEKVFVSAVTVAELHVGVREGAERQALATFLATVDVLDVDEHTEAEAGLIRRDHGKTQGVGLMDALIAATAQRHGLKLFSLNIKHFPSVPKKQLKAPYKKGP